MSVSSASSEFEDPHVHHIIVRQPGNGHTSDSSSQDGSTIYMENDCNDRWVTTYYGNYRWGIRSMSRVRAPILQGTVVPLVWLVCTFRPPPHCLRNHVSFSLLYLPLPQCPQVYPISCNYGADAAELGGLNCRGFGHPCRWPEERVPMPRP